MYTIFSIYNVYWNIEERLKDTMLRNCTQSKSHIHPTFTLEINVCLFFFTFSFSFIFQYKLWYFVCIPIYYEMYINC